MSCIEIYVFRVAVVCHLTMALIPISADNSQNSCLFIYLPVLKFFFKIYLTVLCLPSFIALSQGINIKIENGRFGFC